MRYPATTGQGDAGPIVGEDSYRLRVLYVTDLAYQARGRRYCDEDIFLSTRLRQHFHLALCHPKDACGLMARFDVVGVRNTGPVLHYQAAHRAFCAQAAARGIPVFNELTGKADMVGKQYLVDLFTLGFPVIPTVDRQINLYRLPAASGFVVKPKFGADSIGLQFVDGTTIGQVDTGGGNLLIQPRIDFSYEVSFYFIDHDFQYALYAPDPHRRWGLKTYEPTNEDLAFAQRFIDWNDIDHGIQRVDACRTPAGQLLLVELEDLNPYLSLDLIGADRRVSFVARMAASIAQLAR